LNVMKVELMQQEEDINFGEHPAPYKDHFVLKTSTMFEQPPIPKSNYHTHLNDSQKVQLMGT